MEGIKALPSGSFYDLTVSETHCYFDEQGILHHNSGKDFMVALTQCWITHILLCLRDPQAYLGLAPDEPVDVLVMAYNQFQSRTVYFQKLKSRIRRWPWLRRRINTIVGDDGAADRYLRDGGGYLGADSLVLPNGIRCWALPATEDSGEGKNPIFWVLDELAAFKSPVRVNQAERMHNMVTSSATSRFGNRWRGFAISFPRHSGDYMMQMKDKAHRGELPSTYCVVRATWEVNPKTKRSDFDAHYRRNPEDAAMRYECIPPAAVGSYFRSPALITYHATGIPLSELERYAADWDQTSKLTHVHRGSNPLIDLDSYGDPILDGRGFPKLARNFKGKLTPEGDPVAYYAHLDPGKSGDAFGFALGHLDRLDGRQIPVIDLAFRWTGSMFKDFGLIRRDPWFHDTLPQTQTVTAAEVDFRTVGEFLFYLKQARNFHIQMVSADNWNSVETLQNLSYRGIPVSNHVVSKADYDELKTLIYDRRLIYYGWPILIHELEKVQLLNGSRIEAPRTAEGDTVDSHKDVADAVAAVVWRLVRMAESGVDFAQLDYLSDPDQDPFDQAEHGQVKLELDPDKQAEHQAKAFARFFSD